MNAPNARLKVLKRDKWTCRMPVCLHLDAAGNVDRAISRKLEPPSPWAATVDHIIPKALGGTGMEWNLRAAHAKCNNDAAHGGNWPIPNVVPPVLQDPEAVLGGPGLWQEGVRQERRRKQHTQKRRVNRERYADEEWEEWVRTARRGSWGGIIQDEESA